MNMQKAPGIKESIWSFLLEGLWIDALRTFALYQRLWLKGAALSVIGLTLLYYFTHFFLNNSAWWLTNAAASVALLYFFSTCYLYQEPISGTIRPSLQHFAYVFGCVALVGVSFMLMSLVMMLVFLALLKSLDNNTMLSHFALFGVLALSISICFWALIRSLLVVPLAVNNINLPILTSWRLSKGKFLRLTINSFMLMLIMGPLYFLIDQIGIEPLYIIAQVLFIAVISSFSCTACCVLYGEDITTNLGYERRAAPRN